MAITIIGIPVALQTFKIGLLCLWPFGAEVRETEGPTGCIRIPLNILWIIFGGLWAWLMHVVFGVLLFITIIGYFYGAKTGLITGAAYGILQLITGPYIYAPLQVLLDYPLAFGALGLSGFFCRRKHGLVIGYIVGVIGRYICHVISGYVFFAEYAPEGMNPMVYTLGYNLTYILPEMIVTAVLLCIPVVAKAIGQVKKQANE